MCSRGMYQGIYPYYQLDKKREGCTKCNLYLKYTWGVNVFYACALGIGDPDICKYVKKGPQV